MWRWTGRGSLIKLVIYCFVFTVFIHMDSPSSQSQIVEWLVLGRSKLSVEVVWAGLTQVTLMLGRYICHYHLVYITVVIWYSCDIPDILSRLYYTFSFPWVLFWPNSIMGNGILPESETFLYIARFSSIVSSCPNVGFTVHVYSEIIFITGYILK